jgi:hypothetical protein
MFRSRIEAFFKNNYCIGNFKASFRKKYCFNYELRKQMKKMSSKKGQFSISDSISFQKQSALWLEITESFLTR